MRKLTVKNFSVIKEAELEFGKITVLIGPQSSGKSLLCKLAYFLGKELIELAVRSISNGSSWDEYLQEASKAFWTRFSSGDGVIQAGTAVEFNSYKYQVNLSAGLETNHTVLTFSAAFMQEYSSLLAAPPQSLPAASGALIPGGFSSLSRKEEIWIALNQILSQSILEAVLYIPAGRAFFTSTSKGFALLQNVGIDSIIREFAAQIQWDTRWKVGMMTSGRGVTDEMTQDMTDLARGFVMIDAGIPRFLTTDGRKLSLDVLSTGVQEMLPLFNILEQLMFTREHLVATERATYIPPLPKAPLSSRPLVYLEEPEANVFPSTQYELVKLFAWLAVDPILDFSWVITTHSPYLLTAFNALIEAGQTAEERPDKIAELEKIIPQKYWLKQGDLAACAFNGRDGILRSIIDKESGLIDGDVLDEISNRIGSEFEQILDVQYGD